MSQKTSLSLSFAVERDAGVFQRNLNTHKANLGVLHVACCRAVDLTSVWIMLMRREQRVLTQL